MSYKSTYTATLKEMQDGSTVEAFIGALNSSVLTGFSDAVGKTPLEVYHAAKRFPKQPSTKVNGDPNGADVAGLISRAGPTTSGNTVTYEIVWANKAAFEAGTGFVDSTPTTYTFPMADADIPKNLGASAYLQLLYANQHCTKFEISYSGS